MLIRTPQSTFNNLHSLTHFPLLDDDDDDTDANDDDDDENH